MMELIDKALSLFFRKIKKIYNINVKPDWILFNSEGEEEEEEKEVRFCIYEFVKNPRKGDVCGKMIKEGDFCTVHRKKVEEIEKKKEREKRAESIILLMPKYGYIHKATKFAFFSKENKTVYGKLSIYEKIIPLSDKDVELCKKYRFKYDPKLF